MGLSFAGFKTRGSFFSSFLKEPRCPNARLRLPRRDSRIESLGFRVVWVEDFHAMRMLGRGWTIRR